MFQNTAIGVYRIYHCTVYNPILSCTVSMNGMSNHLSPIKEIPRYAQMARDIEEQIASGGLPPGSRLPSFGRMRTEYGASPATMERVYAALEKKGLIRREAKRGIFVAEREPSRQSGVIGVVWNYDDNRYSYYAQILRGIQNAAHRNGLQVLLIPDVAAVNERDIAGLVLNGFYGDHSKSNYKEDYLKLLPSKLPKVFILCHAAPLPEVVSDDRQGILDAMAHLFEAGHRRIAYLSSGCQGNADDLSRERLAAYHEALAAAGIAAEPSWTRPLFDMGIFAGFREQGRLQMTEWLRDGWADQGCTALLAQNDDSAIGAIEALTFAGYRVPEDISVVGFDGTPGADYFSPRLTTVQVPLQSIGGSCVDMLVEIMAGQNPLHKTRIVLPNTLRVGESTGTVGGPRRNLYLAASQMERTQERRAELVSA